MESYKMNCFMCNKNIDGLNNIHTIYGNHVICDDCFHNNCFLHCNCCEELCYEDWIEDDYYYNDLCPNCMKEKYGRYSHGYKPYPKFHSMNNADRKHCLHVGIELEMEINEVNRFIETVDKNCSEDDFYLKMDGSLNDNYGVEIVSHPMMLPIALAKWEKIFKYINQNQIISNNDCGLHIHLDREYLNERQIRNIDYIINTFNSTIEKLGGRNIVNHCWSASLNKTNEDWGKKTTDDRYVAVNFCKNTIELRCFNSTDDWFNFRWILISVFALVEYAKIHKFDFFQNKSDSEFEVAFHKFINKFKDKELI